MPPNNVDINELLNMGSSNSLPNEEMEVEEETPIPVHMAIEEASMLDVIQGTPEGYFDDKLQLRSYKPLSDKLEDPEFRNIVLNVFKGMDEKDDSRTNKVLSELSKFGTEAISDKTFIPAPGDSNPEIELLAAQGRKGDSLIVLMPMELLQFLSEVSNHMSTNEITGLPQLFKFWKAIGALAGAALGIGLAPATGGASLALAGALGGAAGGAAGSYFGDKDKPGDVWKAAGLGGLAGGAGGYGYHALGLGSSAAPAVIGGLGAGTGVGLGAGLSGTGLGAGAGAGLGAGTGAGLGAGASGASSIASTLSSVAPYLVAASVPSMLMGANAEKQARKDYMQEQKEARERAWEESGLGEPLRVTGGSPRRYIPDNRPSHLFDSREHSYFQNFSKGGHVRNIGVAKKSRYLTGSEDGQKDNIYTKATPGNYIMDATSVGHLGNGNSLAGKNELDSIIKQITPLGKKYAKEERKEKGLLKPVPVAYSASEYEIVRPDVLAIGKGDHKIGVEKLELLRDKIHRLKKSNRNATVSRSLISNTLN